MSNSLSKRIKSQPGKNNTANINIWEAAMHIITTIFIMVLFILLPLGFRNLYYDIGNYKFELFLIISSTYIIAMSLFMVPYVFFGIRADFKNKAEIKVSKYIADGIKQLISKLNIVDKFVLAYAVVCVISFFGSDFHSFIFNTADITLNGAWFGFTDWFMGLRSQFLFILCYFYVSRFFSDKIIRKVYVWIALACTLVCFFGILHRLYIDPFGFYVNLNALQRLEFLSTVGQSSWYSSYLMTVFPLSIGIYFFGEIKDKKILLPVLVISSMSLASQNTDSSFLALFAVFITLFMFSFSENAKMKIFLEIIFIFLISARLMGFLMNVFTPAELKLDTLSLFVLHNNIFWIPIIIVMALYALMLYDEKNGKKKPAFDIQKLSFIRWVVFALCVIFVFGTVIAIIWVNKNNIDIAEDFPLRGYIVFDTGWGNGRGGTWMLTADMFRSFNAFSRLFGCGSDCYGYYAYKHLSEQATDLWHEMYIANAHNEWFNTLICSGFFGLTAYLGIFVSAFVLFIKKRMKHAIIPAAALCIISYVSHGIFCYQTCINTPLIFALIGIGVWYMGKET